MGMNLSRWVSYARARIDAAVGQGNRELDRLEAEREAEVADRPWLRAEGEAPTLDEARARIRWEAEHQEQLRHQATGGDPTPSGDAPGRPAGPATPDRSTTEAPAPAGATAGPRPPEDVAADADVAAARLELEAIQRESASRLEQIRRELGVDPPPDPGP